MSKTITVSKTKRALYFGYGSGGHFLRGGPRNTIDPQNDIPGFPWDIGLLDTGLLKNREVPDDPDGRVHWTGGGHPFWFAFFWWDRSGDKRGQSNSGFYVEGFGPKESREAFAFACAQWPDVVARQLYPLVLTDLPQQAPTEQKYLDIVFDGPPGPQSGRFVEVERDGQSVKVGEWIERGDYWILRIPEQR